MATPYDICFVTVGDKRTAKKISAGLLEQRLAACVSAVPGVESSYRWKGRVEKSSEILLLIKTRRALRDDVIRFVRRHHTYTVPETVFARIDAGSREYLDWLGSNTILSSNIPKDRKPEKK